MKLNEIKIKLDSTNTRLSELTRMRDETSNKLETLQNAFIDGNATIEAVQIEQSKLDTLKASINALESKKNETQKELEAVTDAENLKTSLAKLKALSEDAATAFNAYDSLRLKLGETIESEVEKILAKSVELHAKRREFNDLSKQVAAKHPDEKSLNSAYSEFVSLTPCKFGESIVIAERLAANTKQQKINQSHRANDLESRANA